MGLRKKNIPSRKYRLIVVVLMVAAALTVGCSSADAPERATRIPRSPAPPTSDIGATVDALVQERLSKTITPRTPVTAGFTNEPTGTSTPVGGDNEGTATPAPTPSAVPTPTVAPTATVVVPTSTPTLVDDHGDDKAAATEIIFEESPTVVTGEIEVLDDIDFFEIVNTVPGKTWVFTPEYLPPETSSGRFPTIAIDGTSLEPDLFTGAILYEHDEGTIYLSVSSERFERLGDYRVVIDRISN